MKKILLALCLIFLALSGRAQNGLEGIVVEKYYVSDATDAANSPSPLPVGSVTWRIYVDMLPGYKFQAAYGNSAHTLLMTTTTTFYNNSDFGNFTPSFSATNAKKNTVMLDSWLSVGGACNGFLGILKSEDNGVGTFVNSNNPKCLQNADPSAGIPLTTQDGMIAGAVPTFASVGFTTETDVFNDGSADGNTFTTNSGAWSCLAGAVGPTASNKVLIAQITTDGVFHYELNIQIGTPSGGTQNYVASNPAAGEISDPNLHLSGTLGAANTLPTVTLTAPANGAHSITGDVVALTANAADADGSVTQVQFFVDGVSVGIDNTAPYTANYTGVAGTHTITAVATDNSNATTTSAPVTLTVGNHVAPSVTITAPAANASSLVGDVVTIAASATGNDGSAITSVEFFVDGVSIGVDNTTPYTANYTGVLGSHTLTAKATDDRSSSTTSAGVSIMVTNNNPPAVSITDPTNGQNKTINTVVPISATASDVDGTVASVEFKVNGVSLGSVTTAPYTINWTPAAEGPAVLTAVATDNKGAITTSASVTVNISNPNSLPYQISQVVQTCVSDNVCIPLISTKATMAGVIGYDVVLNYNKTKVMPTGVVTISNDLINSTFTTYITNIDTAHSLMNITIYFKGDPTAPANLSFNGAGQVFCAEFTKTAGFKSVDTATFSVSRLDESYSASPVLTKLVQSGKFITFRDSIFHGSLKFWSNNSPVKYNVARPNDFLITNILGCGKTVNAVQPDTMGNFVYNILNGTSIDIQRNILGTTEVHNVINSQDALMAAQVAAKTNVFIPNVYQIIAMDVNADGQISAGDASQINQRGVLLIPEFRQVWNASNGMPSKDWLFVNTATLAGNAYKISATYPENDGVGFSKYKVPVVDFCQSVPVTNSASCPLINSDVYTGIMLGDVDATYAGIAHDGLLKSSKAAEDKIIINLTQAVSENGNINVPVSLTSGSVVNSFDFDVVINDAKITVNRVISPSELNTSWNYLADKKKLLVGTYSLNPIPTQNTVTLSLSSINGEAISKSDFTATLSKINGNPVNLEVIDAPTGIGQITNDGNVRIYPNPASDVLKVEVSEVSTIRMFDMNGKQVVSEADVKANQVHSINVEGLSSGIYVIKVSNNKFVEIQKVVIRK